VFLMTGGHAQRETDSVTSFLARSRLRLLLIATGGVLLFWPALARLVRFWSTNEDYSHGFLVPVVSAVVLFLDRKRLAMLPARRSFAGLVLTIASLSVYVAGVVLSLHSCQRFAVWGTLVGAVWYSLGPAILRCQRFAFLFLLLAIPPPYFVLDGLKLALKNVATRLSAETLLWCGYPALPEGNVLDIGGREFEIADACSGIRSLMAILTTAIFVAYLVRAGVWKGLLLCAVAIPLTIAVNVVRVLTVAVVAVRLDVDLSAGWSHQLLGYATYLLSFLLLLATWKLVDWTFRGPASEASGMISEAPS